MGLLERVQGYYVRDEEDDDLGGGGRGYATRWRATPDLIALAARHHITPENVWDHFKETFDDAMPVVVRAAKGSAAKHGKGRAEALKLEPSGRLEEVARTVRGINLALRGVRWNLHATPFLVRIFSNGDVADYRYNKGGRLYCRTEDNYQQRKLADRLKITMNGEACAEVDVQASQLCVFYARCGDKLDLSEDPYAIEGIERKVVKGLITASFGKGGLPTRWPRGLREDYFAAHGRAVSEAYKLKDVKDRLMARHPVLSKLKPGKNDALVLQYEESEAIIAAMLDILKFNGVALPIHDSLLATGEHTPLAEAMLRRAYRDRFGVEVRTRIHWGEAEVPDWYIMIGEYEKTRAK